MQFLPRYSHRLGTGHASVLTEIGRAFASEEILIEQGLSGNRSRFLLHQSKHAIDKDVRLPPRLSAAHAPVDRGLTIRGDDPAYASGGTPQLASAPPPILQAAAPLTPSQLQPIVTAAIDYWTALPAYGGDVALLEQVPLVIAHLPGLMLGETIANDIVIDPTAAGYGWFVDSSPFDSTEFGSGASQPQAGPGSPAFGRMDLLTVVMHEGIADVRGPSRKPEASV